MTLGERIKNQRTRAGLSQERVAELVGVSRQSVTKWESGQSAPSTENLFRLAEIFGTTVDMLLDIPDEKNAQSTDQAQIKELTSQIQYLYRVESARKAEAERVRIENEKRIEEIQNKSNKGVVGVDSVCFALCHLSHSADNCCFLRYESYSNQCMCWDYRYRACRQYDLCTYPVVLERKTINERHC